MPVAKDGPRINEEIRVREVQLIDATGHLTEDDLEPEARDELLEAFRGWRDAWS